MTGMQLGLGSVPATSASSSDLHNHSQPFRDGNSVVVDNPMPHRLPEGENAAPLEVIGTTASDKLIIIMVGLPATGKTHIAKRICRFLSFFHDIPSQIFNVGDYRRQLFGAKMPANFYDPSNAEGLASRTMACDAALADLIDYIKQDGVRVAAFDATNSTSERRRHIMQRLKDAGLGAKRMFVESICDQEGVSSPLQILLEPAIIYRSTVHKLIYSRAIDFLSWVWGIVNDSCLKKTFEK